MISRVGAALPLVFCIHTGTANAATIAVNGAPQPSCAIVCAFCAGLLSNGAFSENEVDTFELGDADNAAIAEFLSTILGMDIPEADVSVFGWIDGSTYLHSVRPGYFFTRHGDRRAFFRSDDEQDIDFVEPDSHGGTSGSCGILDGEILGFQGL